MLETGRPVSLLKDLDTDGGAVSAVYLERRALVERLRLEGDEAIAEQVACGWWSISSRVWLSGVSRLSARSAACAAVKDRDSETRAAPLVLRLMVVPLLDGNELRKLPERLGALGQSAPKDAEFT
ncbi:hypothetical protein [Palleronia marisminoris]|uniref:hypothetical protein n=1 Tax=Palleronia marisminoris TaxID=315423 RepID=UPI001113E002|nr:hypothetical protein [Palleronia marisminoris]